MLRRCAKTINATSPTAAQNAYGSLGWSSATQSGTLATAMIELNDT